MKIVLADASRVVLKILARLLTEHGHAVTGCTSGEEALERIRADAGVDVLITSLELPAMSGFELCWECRLIGGRDRPIYILAMSSLAAQERLAEALDSGADDFIGKPPQREELFARLRAAERLSLAQRELIRLANRDPLTDLLNRRAFFQAGAALLERAKAGGGSQERATATGAAVLIADIDHFKRINDTCGHDAGDQVIVHVARTMAGLGEVCGRLGGEEFAMVLADGRPETVWAKAEALRGAIASSPVRTSLQAIPVTLSVGTALIEPGETVEAALRRADLALYAAKRGGRNRVVAADGPGAPAGPIPPGGPAPPVVEPLERKRA